MAVPASTLQINMGTAPKLHKDVYPAISAESLAGTMHGRVVLVTGAGRGIGRAIALSFAQTGASGVALLSRTASQLESVASEITSKYPKTRTLVCIADASDRDAVTKALKDVEKELGTVDVLVANAGIGGMRPFAHTPNEWWNIIEVNLKGPMMLTEMVLHGMRSKNTGVVLLISSRAGVVNIPGASSYCVSKAGLIRACSCLQSELDMEAGGESGIHTYVLHPGGVKTDMSTSSLHSDTDKLQPGFVARWRSMADGMLYQTPELCAQTCVYLATGKAKTLRGRYVDVGDDIEDLTRQADIIHKEDMYDLGVATLGGQISGKAFSHLRGTRTNS